jgi:TPR repeat protein
VDAAFNLGILYAGRDDEGAALQWYERAAAGGHTEAALQAGIARLRDGDERDAERHLRCAAGGGSAEGAYRLATVLDARQPPVGPPALGECVSERAECEEWYERAAEQGHRRAQVRVGIEAAEAGSRNGAFNLGLLLAREGSEPEAALWWTRAADAGHGRAALRLALLCARRGDLVEGQRWAHRAVELGPAEVSERAGRLRDALRSELSA